MKTKLAFLTLALFSVSAIAVAQKTPFLQLGLKGGVNVTKVDGKSFKDEFNYGFHLGGFAAIKLGEKVGIQPEVLFNQYATKADTSYNNVLNASNLKNVKLNYLSIPLLLNITPSKFITFQAGPQFGILIDKNQDLYKNGKAAFKSGDLSLLGGVQLNIMNVRVGARYFVGLSDISDVDNSDKWKNQGFQVSVGLRII